MPSVVRLPPQVRSPFSVYVNGVPQRLGDDYQVRGGSLVFQRELVKEGRVAVWRWIVGAFGVGTYRRNDSVDVSYELEGRPMLAQGLEIESRP
ncbi:MAG TPA: hypothetical protein VHX88_16105 [Solirubrobacteraceae bacterium]|jgi:hypothetical protein|nr:hypothetical protein [Solirubrobacteraceae bacterium]